MTRQDVLIIAQFAGLGENANNRFGELARLFDAAGADVELVSSRFWHTNKVHHSPAVREEFDFPVTLIEEPGYPTNVSLRRIASHRTMARNLTRYLEGRHTPDIIYCAIPSVSVAAAAAEYARRKGVHFVLDVQDLWPEAFEVVLRPRPLAAVALTPMRRKVERLYCVADTVVTVSQTYSDRVADARGSNDNIHTVFLGTHLDKFDQHPVIAPDTPENIVNLVYIGTLGRNYNLPLIFDALRELHRREVGAVLHIMGSGPTEAEWKRQAEDLGNSVIFHGRVSYAEMVGRLRGSDIAVNPIVPGAANSITNKIGDYAAAGLPVVNSQDLPEYRKLLADYGAGISCAAEPGEVADAVVKLAADPDLRRRMGKGNRRMAEERFDRAETYPVLTAAVLEHGA